jgi:LmbE family N-acetylglucosaminyl deacetylase
VLSPHLDDAAFSAWHVLARSGPVRVVNVFAGVPEAAGVTPLDRAHGAVDSRAWMRRRRADDRAVHTMTGCETVHLDLLDVQYRADNVPEIRAAIELDPSRFIPLVAPAPDLASDLGEMRHAVVPWLTPAAVVYASTGIGGHPDHRDVARLGVELAREGWDVRLYADSPYFLRQGLPSWLGDEPNATADEVVDDALRLLSPACGGLRPQVVDLGAEQASRKIDAARRYRTEFRFIDEDFAGIASDPEAMRREAYWALR